MFIVADRLSQLVAKGEITPGYYNPGDFFDEVHLLTTTNDVVDSASLQITAGKARLVVHRLWKGSDLRNTVLTPLVEREWRRRAVRLAEQIVPDMVRTGDRLTGYLGAAVKRRLQIPHVVSLHSHRDDLCVHTRWGPRRLMLELEKRYARVAMSNADAVVVVYESLVSYARNNGARRIECIYNVICPTTRKAKASYELQRPARIISVGRQIPRKLVTQLVLSMHSVDAHLVLVGNGLAHEQLRSLVRANRLDARVEFIESMANDALCESLSGFDLFAVHTEYPEFPKSIIEALWAGLPVIVNDNQSLTVPELQGDWVYRVKDSAEAYAAAIDHLVSSDSAREQLGRRGRAYAEQTFDPRMMEQRMTELYGEFVG